MDDASRAQAPNPPSAAIPQTGPPSPASKPERGIVCPRCGRRRFRTTHTEPLPSGRIRRRKVCRHCDRRMVTYELPPRMAGPDRYM